MNDAQHWPQTPAEALVVQQQLRGQVTTHDDFGEIAHVAGVDVGFEQDGAVARAAVVVLAFPSLEPRDYAVARLPVAFPYVPGFLSFRETPVIVAALEQLRVRPDMLIADGQGIAHPRRFGIACHLGLLVGIPSIGCGKSRLVGQHDEPGNQRGDWAALVDRGELIGVVLRTKPNTKPVYVSPGHRVSHESAIRLVMACTTRYRLPETTRAAHNLASNRVPPVLAPAATQQRLL